MFITISRKADVYNVANDHKITHILSTLDPGDTIKAPTYIKDHLLYNFDDIEISQSTYSPKPEHVAEILEWSHNLTHDDRLLVHCWAGISRSTALGLAIWVQKHGKDYEAARKWLLETRPIACPNRLIAGYADQILNCDGKLLQLADEIGSTRLIGKPL